MNPVGTTTLSAASDLQSLVARRAAGFGLEGAFYSSQPVFDLDIEAIFLKHWLFCAAEAEIPEPGDFVTINIGSVSVIILRDDDEGVRAFHNVCRHRGSRLLKDSCGAIGNLVCPYHQWTYRTDGSLAFAESQPATFDREQFGLKPVNVRTVGGLIFICCADDAPADFEEVAGAIEPFLSPFDLKNTKVAHQMDLVEEGNWKLVVENNRECYHCDAAHPELLTAYFPVYRYSDDDITPRLRPMFERYQKAYADLERACALHQFPRDERRELDSRVTGFQITHLPLDGDGSSFGPNGAAVCKKTLGSITDTRFGDLSLHMQPNSWFHFLSDHAVVFRVLPVAPNKSIVRTTWLVHPEAVEGVDYDVESLTAVWRATNDEDRELVEGTQQGVSSPGYVPGPYSKVEDDVDAFVNWYVGRLRDHLAV